MFCSIPGYIDTISLMAWRWHCSELICFWTFTKYLSNKQWNMYHQFINIFYGEPHVVISFSAMSRPVIYLGSYITAWYLKGAIINCYQRVKLTCYWSSVANWSPWLFDVYIWHGCVALNTRIRYLNLRTVGTSEFPELTSGSFGKYFLWWRTLPVVVRGRGDSDQGQKMVWTSPQWASYVTNSREIWKTGCRVSFFELMSLHMELQQADLMDVWFGDL